MNFDLLSTNPVLLLDRLAAGEPRDEQWLLEVGELDDVVVGMLADGICLPPHAVHRWRRLRRLSPELVVEAAGVQSSPGVVGLVQDAMGCAYVVPLMARRGPQWRLDPPLPARAETVVALLRDLCAVATDVDAAGVDAHGFPEAKAIHLSTRFPIACDGPSMDVALLLAALGALAETPPSLLRATCAVVTREGGRLVPSGGSALKLAAFHREIERGSLLVHAPGDAAAAAASAWFEEVWEVDSLEALARRLLLGGLLRPFAEPTPVDALLGEALLHRLRKLAEHEQHHAEVVVTAERLLSACWLPSVPSRLRLAAMTFLPASLRHLGRHREALSSAQEWQVCVDSNPLFTYEDQAVAALEVAASLFDPGREREALEVLGPWLDRLQQDPCLVSAKTRVRIWNTAGRARSHLGKAGWDELFLQSLAVQELDDPAGVARTTNYRISACLRSGELDRAQVLLGEHHDADDVWRAFLCADLARRRGLTWADARIEAEGQPPGKANHPCGFYWLATARQPRIPADAASRYEHAAACFRRDVAGCEQGNVLWTLVHAAELAAAQVRGDADATASWCALLAAVGQPGLEGLSARVSPFLPPDPRGSVEPFFANLPWL
ncbi:MAG: hypothetical protein K8J09_19730 [Planctomycetes bacterium]|nr:hypothetical protein [Planctomycetota bacterium]